MDWLKVLGWLAALVVALGTVGALAGMATRTLDGPSPILVLALTAAYVGFASLAGMFRSGGLSTAYW
ncbi:MAG: hypothetical protein ACI9PP_000012 [Halobacteriales archaeon]|jgi:hypothetical protein